MNIIFSSIISNKLLVVSCSWLSNYYKYRADCVNGQNLSYYITVPGYQRYALLNDMLLCKCDQMKPSLYAHNSTPMFLTVPFTSYSFEVLAYTTEGEGEFSVPRSFTTLQAPPTSPLNLNVNVLSYSSLLVSWSPPTCSNGIILGYMVRGSMILKLLYL